MHGRIVGLFPLISSLFLRAPNPTLLGAILFFFAIFPSQGFAKASQTLTIPSEFFFFKPCISDSFQSLQNKSFFMLVHMTKILSPNTSWMKTKWVEAYLHPWVYCWKDMLLSCAGHITKECMKYTYRPIYIQSPFLYQDGWGKYQQTNTLTFTLTQPFNLRCTLLTLKRVNFMRSILRCLTSEVNLIELP